MITPETFKSAFPNFDIATALANLCDNTMLLHKVMNSFYAQYKDTGCSEIRTYIDENKIEDATRSAHTIKGLAASLGALCLQKASLELELACKGQNPTIIEEMYTNFKQVFETTISEMQTGLEQTTE